MKTKTVLGTMILGLLAIAGSAYSHCEIPCGIYDDAARVAEMREHVTTIEKSMNQIIAISGSTDSDYNQLVRWITNKEDHANKLQEIATQYFMFQRIKPVDPANAEAWSAYQNQLTLMHKITVFGMKTKQTTELDHIATLRALIDEFEKVYFKN